jgi:hypothetical protein
VRASTPACILATTGTAGTPARFCSSCAGDGLGKKALASFVSRNDPVLGTGSPNRAPCAGGSGCFFGIRSAGRPVDPLVFHHHYLSIASVASLLRLTGAPPLRLLRRPARQFVGAVRDKEKPSAGMNEKRSFRRRHDAGRAGGGWSSTISAFGGGRRPFRLVLSFRASVCVACEAIRGVRLATTSDWIGRGSCSIESSQATVRLPSGYRQATVRLPSGYPKGRRTGGGPPRFPRKSKSYLRVSPCKPNTNTTTKGHHRR